MVRLHTSLHQQVDMDSEIHTLQGSCYFNEKIYLSPFFLETEDVIAASEEGEQLMGDIELVIEKTLNASGESLDRYKRFNAHIPTIFPH